MNVRVQARISPPLAWPLPCSPVPWRLWEREPPAMAREAPILRLSAGEEHQLRKLAHAASTPQALAFRARLILHCAAQPGVPRNDHVAALLGCHPDTVSKWRRRLQRRRSEGLAARPRT